MSDLRPACVTNYDSLYARGYYAHQAGAASFDVARLPPIIAAAAARHGGRVIDIGGGNGGLAACLAGSGIATMTLDAAAREGPGYIRLDLSRHDPALIETIRRIIAAELGPTWLATCLDVAEHIDPEHLGDFLLNISVLVESEAIISISTRPSSAGNRFHASILPIETWIRLLEDAGFAVSRDEACEALRSPRMFAGADEALVAVAHWQRLDPFRERHAAHQHYLRIARSAAASPDPEALRRSVRQTIDIVYREEKRASVGTAELPMLVYSVNFIQDWSFARSLADVWPAERFRVILRKDIIAEPYLHVLKGFLARTGLAHAVISSVTQGMEGLRAWGALKDMLVVTATEGLVSMTHLLGSSLLLDARRHGARTLCLQHGMTSSRAFAPAAAVFGAWDEGSEAAMRPLVGPSASFRVTCTGSPKFLDALLPTAGRTLESRFGAFVAEFERSVLIGLNLHWDVHTHSADETYAWIERLCARNPSTLFLLRPHPDDATLFERPELMKRHNLVPVDELTLLSLDWSVARLLRAVDGVITTFSTLVIDAVAAERPVVMLPSRAALTQCAANLPVSLPLAGGMSAIPTLSAEDWAEGSLPLVLSEGRCPAFDRAWFAPSRASLRRIAAVADRDTPGRLDLAERGVANALVAASRRLDLDSNPHRDRTRLSAALSAFLTRSAASTG
jgi:hypothetical protein